MPPRPRISREANDRLEKFLIGCLCLNVTFCFGAYFSGKGQQNLQDAQFLDALEQARARTAELSENK
jgi:hypothetical protein